ncbi:hypothetical protein GOB48_22140 [Sinorhizobium meliloti]|nr:hypothetical protein [Sinorhizobium meliloti]
MRFELKWDKDNPEAELSAIVVAYHEALTAALKALAEEKGTEDLAWFDQLHQASIKAAKGTVADGLPIEVDASAVRLGFETLDRDFKSIRTSLLKGE